MNSSIPDIQCPPATGSLTAALDLAEAACRTRGASLTAIRREVLELLYRSPTGVKAYDLLAQIKEARPGASPPTIYRALDFLLENGLVHRISSLNAFVGCSHPEHPHQGQFLICRNCHAAIELEQKAISDAIVQSARDVGFTVEGQTVEVVGLCSGCREA